MRFTKQGNMRYISHLDLHRLFKRSLKKAGIAVDYSKGYNPHEMINVVQPLSLGFESVSEYFELETPMDLDKDEAAAELNAFLPEGIKFTASRKIPLQKKNLSAYSEYASYEIRIPDGRLLSAEKARAFLSRDKVTVIKKDKKTKQPVEKDVRNMIKSFESVEGAEGEEAVIHCLLRCATNENLNPLSLAESFASFCGLSPEKGSVRVTRLEIYGLKEGALVPLLELYPGE
jgi:radical SAM-linked protein